MYRSFQGSALKIKVENTVTFRSVPKPPVQSGYHIYLLVLYAKPHQITHCSLDRSSIQTSVNFLIIISVPGIDFPTSKVLFIF
jgi:phosphatidylethanolamine-binding protein (PEBP) family uncharacterized protein